MSTSDKLIELAERRVALRARIERQREGLSEQAGRIKPLLGVLDRGISLARYLKQHPAPLAAALTVAVVLRPRRLFTWGRRAWLGWKIWRGLHERLHTIRSR